MKSISFAIILCCCSSLVFAYNVFLINKLIPTFRSLHNTISREILSIHENREIELYQKYHRFIENLEKISGDVFEHNLNITADCYKPIGRISKLFDTFLLLNKELELGNVREVLNSFTNQAHGHYLQNFRSSVTKNCIETIMKAESSSILKKLSQQQIFINVYLRMVITEVLAMVMLSFSHLYKRNYLGTLGSSPNYTLLKTHFSSLSREIWIQDPDVHIKDKTYLEIEKFVQGYVQYERALNKDGNCKKSCTEFHNITNTPNKNCGGDSLCNAAWFKCSGDIDDCIDAGSQISLCYDTKPRMYKYMKYKTTTYGEYGYCPPKSFIETYGPCSYCLCLCYHKFSSAKYISLRAAKSNISLNKVITGVRFRRKNNVVHIQIQEGKLGAFGRIEGNVSWVDIENFRLSDRKIALHQDFFNVDRYNRGVNLDDIVYHKNNSTNRVITGVRFKKLEGRLILEIFLTRFKYDTGRLVKPQESSIWYMQQTTARRSTLNIRNPDLPNKSPQKSIMTSNGGNFLMFTHTSFEADMAQTTVPFLDMQDVESSIPGPLSGIGIYYKKISKTPMVDYGGFLGLKIFTYDPSYYFKN